MINVSKDTTTTCNHHGNYYADNDFNYNNDDCYCDVDDNNDGHDVNDDDDDNDNNDDCYYDVDANDSVHGMPAFHD